VRERRKRERKKEKEGGRRFEIYFVS